MIEVDWSIESGSLTMYDVSENTIRLVPRRDYDWEGRNWTAIWCYFCVRGARGKELTLKFLDLTDEWNRKPSFSWGPNTRPVYSYDQQTWRRFEHIEYEPRSRTLIARCRPESDTLWAAYIEPYPTARLQRFLEDLRARRAGAQIGSLGASVNGRAIPFVYLGSQPSRRHAIVVCRQHPWETGTSFAAEGLIEFLASNAPEAQEVLDQIAFTVIPIANPDGVIGGGTRYNALGYDPNRNYDSVSIETCPETYHLLRMVESVAQSGQPFVIFNLHNNNQETGDYIVGDHRPLAGFSIEHFGDALARHTFFRGPVRLRPEPIVSVFGRPLPMVLLELRTGYDPTLGRYVTYHDQKAYGAGLARAIYRAMVSSP